MTETAASGDSPATTGPLEGTPNSNGEVPMEVDDVEDSTPTATGSSASPSSLPKTPISIKKPSEDCFKTPEPLTPTSAMKRKRLTPEEKNLRDKERQEKRRKLEEEKQKREQEKIEKAKQKEAERLKKEEEKRRADEDKKRVEEQKKAERQKKEEERKRIEEEKKQERIKKEEERKRIEEERKQERLKKEEERKRKEEERKLKVEEKEREKMKIEEKKAKQAQIFTNFFQKSSAPKVQTIDTGNLCNPSDSTTSTSEQAEERNNNLASSSPEATAKKINKLFNPLPFQIKTDMAVAPLCRRKMSDEERTTLTSLFRNQDEIEEILPDQKITSNNYLDFIKTCKGRSCGRTEVKGFSKDSQEIQVLDDNIEGRDAGSGYVKWRMKLLQFHENRRPAYWGTWKRKAKRTSNRRPLAREEEIDYDFDSDDEWEDEPEDAEEIGDSDREEPDEQEEAPEGDDEEEGWMVPHGYLSDSEREGTGGDLESFKNKEKEFYKSLKEKSSIGLPYIETEHLSCFIMRLCPVFKSAMTIKPAPRKPKQSKAKAPSNPVDPTPSTMKVPVTSADFKTNAVQTTEVARRRTKRTPKPPKPSTNPYAEPPTGFLAMDLPSDDDDMEWEASETLSSSSASDSDSPESTDDEHEDDEDERCNSNRSEATSSDSDEELFTPVIVKKSKKPSMQ